MRFRFNGTITTTIQKNHSEQTNHYRPKIALQTHHAVGSSMLFILTYYIAKIAEGIIAFITPHGFL